MYRTNRDRVTWLTPLVFPIIATSRQGIIDFDISSAGLMNNSPGNRIETVYIIHFFSPEPNATLHCSPIFFSVRRLAAYFKSFEKKK